jgi:hypothetical protein
MDNQNDFRIALNSLEHLKNNKILSDFEGGKLTAYREMENLILPVVMPSLQSMNFREMRKAKGLTLREVEETTGLSNAYLSQLETGKVKSPGYNVVRLLYDLYSNVV